MEGGSGRTGAHGVGERVARGGGWHTHGFRPGVEKLEGWSGELGGGRGEEERATVMALLGVHTKEWRGEEVEGHGGHGVTRWEWRKAHRCGDLATAAYWVEMVAPGALALSKRERSKVRRGRREVRGSSL